MIYMNLILVCINKNKLTYFIEKKFWTRLKVNGSLPSPRCGHTATLWNDKMIIIGGKVQIEDSFQCFNDVYIYDFESNIFSKLKSLDQFSARAFHSALLRNSNEIWIFGGYDHDNPKIKSKEDLFCLKLNIQVDQNQNTDLPEFEPNEKLAHLSLKSQLFEFLEKFINEKKLVELHTHLMGMGSWEFWIDKIMKKYIPEQFESTKNQLNKLEFYQDITNLNHKSVIDEIPTFPQQKIDESILKQPQFYSRCSKEVQDKIDNENKLRFTTDVIYAIETFKRVLDIQDIEEISNRFGNINGFKNDLEQEWTIFNARTQLFEIRKGISNDQLLKYLKGHEHKILPVLKNCFSMLEPNGKPAEKHTIHQLYQGKFTPEFYPRRFQLKDDMYSQYLGILDQLLHHVLDQYYESGVGYVEFSIGFGDLIERPWVFKHLYNVALKEKRVISRFLIGFNRLFTPELSQYQDPISHCFDKKIYQDHLKQLERLKQKLANSESAQELMRYVVGFDYMSDEKNRPFCPFGLDEFIQFITECRFEHNSKFGVRYHCGEMKFDLSKSSHFVHIEITCTIIKKIIESDIPLRLGHGIAFLAFEQDLNKPQNYLSSSIQKIVETIKILKDKRIPLEINLRSNEFLVMGMENKKAVEILSQKMHVPIVLSTDNDGVWDVQTKNKGKWYRSVAGEYASAIQEGVIPNKARLEQFIKDSESACFDSDKRTKKI